MSKAVSIAHDLDGLAPKDMAYSINKMMVEITPLRIGSMVSVNEKHPNHKDFQGAFIVTRLDWDYRGDGRLNISIASEKDIHMDHPSFDGFTVDDLDPMPQNIGGTIL
ncbi:hypothetical protein [Lentilitoribacter sp. Alg239-R112]|uniref:hypothetical protein n=1 Tax=Lentilitoribacter sp. Alg239-R112 TaxID=2305987 RepID=UPI0013A6B242|nr:hypothetical protein [Lentilitoribacter sp. Alg239-R112]